MKTLAQICFQTFLCFFLKIFHFFQHHNLKEEEKEEDIHAAADTKTYSFNQCHCVKLLLLQQSVGLRGVCSCVQCWISNLVVSV